MVDLRSFTKAAISLGVTQPAVSAQIKRLQFLIGDDIFDRSTQGVSLTPHGDIVISYARRLLSLNDQIVHLGDAGPRPELVIRVGTPNDYVASALPATLARFPRALPRSALCRSAPIIMIRWRASFAAAKSIYWSACRWRRRHDARHCLAREVVWVHGKTTSFDPNGPVPLVTYGASCMYHRLATRALKDAGLRLGRCLHRSELHQPQGCGRRRARRDGDHPPPREPGRQFDLGRCAAAEAA